MSGDDTTSRPKTPDEIIEDAVGGVLADFQTGHPATYGALTRRLKNPTELLVTALKEDAAYQALVEQTEKELDVAAIVKVIIGVALRVVERFLIGGIL